MIRFNIKDLLETVKEYQDEINSLKKTIFKRLVKNLFQVKMDSRINYVKWHLIRSKDLGIF